MRILDRGNIQVSIKDLGFGEDDYSRFQQIIKRPNGIFLVTGPTGSGKTTTLYAALNELNRPDRKIITAEDPVEYYLPGINQVRGEAQHRPRLRAHHPRHAAAGAQHHPRRRNPRPRNGRDRHPGVFDGTLGFQHAAHERCAQRHYTSGRYRRAAVPGRVARHRHHGAASGADRLPQVQGAGHAAGARNQGGRASRRSSSKTATFMRGRGCSHCNHTGYRGRKGIFEMLRMTAAMREMTFKREPTQTIRRQARLHGHADVAGRRHSEST